MPIYQVRNVPGSIVRALVLLTHFQKKRSDEVGSDYIALPSEPLSRESKQAKAAEWHAVAIVLLLPLLLPPVLLMMGIAIILDFALTCVLGISCKWARLESSMAAKGCAAAVLSLLAVSMIWVTNQLADATADWHTVAIVGLPLLMLLEMGLCLRCFFTPIGASPYFNINKERCTVMVGLLLALFILLEALPIHRAADWHTMALVGLTLLMLLGSFLCLRCFHVPMAKVTDSTSTPEATTPSEAHAAQVLELLLEGGTIGRGEVAQNTVSVATTLRYAVLRITQFFVSCVSSFLLLLSGLVASLYTCNTGYEKLPIGATKYVVVDFNAWVYSGVHCLLCSHPPNHPHLMTPTTARVRPHSLICCGRRSSKSSTMRWKRT